MTTQHDIAPSMTQAIPHEAFTAQFGSIHALLSRSELFCSLDQPTIETVVRAGQIIQYQAGETIIREDEQDMALYVILSGDVDVVRYGTEGQKIVIATLTSGDTVGEISLLIEKARTATVETRSETYVFRLLTTELAILQAPQPHSAYGELMNSLGRILANRLETSTDRTFNALQDDLEQARYRHAAASFILYIMLTSSAYVVFIGILSLFPFSTAVRDLLGNALIIVLAIIFINLIRLSPYPLKAFGFTIPDNLGRHLWDTAVWTTGLIGLSIVAKAIAIQVIPALANEPLFYLPWDGSTRLDEGFSLTYTLIYFVFAPMQEIVARGALQSSLAIFMQDQAYPQTKAILASNALFAAAHVYLSPLFAFVTFVSGLVWGFQYARQRSLIGVSISHIVAGLFVLRFLGLLNLVRILEGGA